jgi:hypothetical protein
MMEVIGTKESLEQTRRDWPRLLKEHKKALRTQPTWAFFGGVITIEGREYQVVEASNRPVSRVQTVRVPRQTKAKRRRGDVTPDDLGHNV